MKESRRADLLLASAALIILGTLAVYVVLIWSWFSDKPAAQAAAVPHPVYDDGQRALGIARVSFRDNLLDARAALQLSEALLHAGRDVDAFYVMEWARDFYPPEAFRRAHDEIVLSKTDPAGDDTATPTQASLEARLKDEPDNPAVLAELARLLIQQGQTAKAKGLVDTGLAARPDDPGLSLVRAQLTVDSDPDSAIGDLARVANGSPKSWEAKQALAQLQALASKAEDSADGEASRTAREALEELIKAAPQEPGPFMALGLGLWARGDGAPTRALVAQELAKRSPNPAAFALDGALAQSDGRLDAALKSFTKAWDQNPDDLYTAGKLAQLLYKQAADSEAALPFYIALYRNDPDYSDGQPAETIVRSILDARRKQTLATVTSDGLGRYFTSDDASLRAEACARAADFKDPRWIDALSDLLDDDTEIVRHNADYALYQIAHQYPDAVRVRRDQWLSRASPFTRARALNLFADLDANETYPLAAKALYDPNAGLRFLVKTMIMDHYYAALPVAQAAVAEYLKREKDPRVLAMYALAPQAPSGR